ncbi:hypothetical protein [Microbacterium esteraromaticum]|uniref:hypothetical protein n=1 Tax=Microbacterium esteraromaticum TaxID=57043 RepID=UPI0019D3F863|nr:hypothetical protein [Microbacterium esteraromaticum]MBN7792432.1 hypothetical protein [Microbacterium esteraromaticum]
MTAADYAPWGIGEPDEDGWYPDYRPIPQNLKPAHDGPSAPSEAPQVDTSWLAIVEHWRVVVADLAREFHVDVYDAAVRARPWPGVRTMIFALLESPTRLREALTRR